MVIALLLPFEPNVSFSTPVLLERNDKNDFNAYDKYTIKMTNNSNYPIWCQTYNVSCFASASERFEVAHGAAGRAAFGNYDFRRGPVNVAVITLKLISEVFPMNWRLLR